MRKHLLASPALVALLAGSAVGVSAQSPAPEPGGLVTEEMLLGVERIVRDDAGHDLDEKHPTYRYDTDGITVTPDGTIWLATTYSRSDNRTSPFDGFVWALGRQGTFNVVFGRPPVPDTTYLYVQPDGTRTIVESQVVSTSDPALIPAVGWMDPRWDRDAEQVVVATRSDGEHSCRATRGRLGVTCEDPSGETTTYLPGQPINQIAAAPDGTVWAVGGYAGDNGGVYHISFD